MMLGNHPVEYRIEELRNLRRPTAVKPQYSYTTVTPQESAMKKELNELREAIQTLSEKIDRLEKKDE